MKLNWKGEREMDTNPEYIKMCEKAKELQNHYLNTGDYYCRLPSHEIKLVKWADQRRVSGIELKEYGTAKTHVRVGNIWLPRQEDLQRMIEDDAITQIQKLWGWIITSKYVPVGMPQPSMEQLWLCFVMDEKYNKIWDGTNWI